MITGINKKIYFILAAIAVLMPVLTFTQNASDIQYEFTRADSGYTFYSNFKINADPDCLLEIIFNYEHIRALAPDAKEVVLVDQGMDWNRISYTFQKFIYFENKSEWYRKIDKEKHRVDFTMVSSENNYSIMPRMISSSGFYKIKQQEGFIIVEYYQQCHLTKMLITELFYRRVKKEAIEFMYKFLDYADAHCMR